MPGIDGLELQSRLNDAKSGVPIIFVTAHDNTTYRKTAMAAGPVSFFRKPFDANAFVAAVQVALARGSSFGRTSSSRAEEAEGGVFAKIVPLATTIVRFN
jgi:FixJ family two-component response regulator